MKRKKYKKNEKKYFLVRRIEKNKAIVAIAITFLKIFMMFQEK